MMFGAPPGRVAVGGTVGGKPVGRGVSVGARRSLREGGPTPVLQWLLIQDRFHRTDSLNGACSAMASCDQAGTSIGSTRNTRIPMSADPRLSPLLAELPKTAGACSPRSPASTHCATKRESYEGAAAANRSGLAVFAADAYQPVSAGRQCRNQRAISSARAPSQGFESRLVAAGNGGAVA